MSDNPAPILAFYETCLREEAERKEMEATRTKAEEAETRRKAQLENQVGSGQKSRDST